MYLVAFMFFKFNENFEVVLRNHGPGRAAREIFSVLWARAGPTNSKSIGLVPQILGPYRSLVCAVSSDGGVAYLLNTAFLRSIFCRCGLHAIAAYLPEITILLSH